MDKRILLPTDFSKNSLNAILYGLDLYADQKCVFYLLNVYQVDGFSVEGSSYSPEPGQRSYELEKRESEEQFKKIMEILRLRINNPKHSYETIITYNTLFEATKDIIAKKDIDIIIMGTKGMTASTSIIVGTNAINLMEGITECPVLVVPEEVRFSPPEEIVFPTDYKKPFKRRELKYLMHIAQMHTSFIRVLYVKKSDKFTKAQKENKNLLDIIFKDVEHSYHELENISVQGGINAFISSRGSDMVAFVNYKHNFFRKILSKPLVKELGYHSKVPVLVLKNRG